MKLQLADKISKNRKIYSHIADCDIKSSYLYRMLGLNQN